MNFKFFKHPKQVCMTYFEHFKLSMNFSKLLAIGALKAFVHVILPIFILHLQQILLKI